MFKNYLKIAFRNIIKHKFYSLINVVGLAIGMASFLLIVLYIFDEVSYDRQHQHADRIFRVINASDFEGVGETSTSSPCPLAPALALEFPESIEQVVRFYNDWNTAYFIEQGEHRFKESRFFFVDSTVFNVFDIPFVKGNPETALLEPRSVVLTQSMAQKYFGDDDPIGKTIKWQEHIDFTVRGIIEDAPRQSHIQYQFLASISTLRVLYRNGMPKTWYWNPFWTYVLLKEGVQPETLDQQFPQLVAKYYPVAQKEKKRLYLQALSSIHLDSDLDYEIEANGNRSYLVILSVIAGFMLLIASINFMNLATATSAGRAREVGIKKVFGADRRNLMIQFLAEALVLSGIALLLALLLMELVMPAFNNFTSKDLSLSLFLNGPMLLLLMGLVLITAILSGLYPAFFLSHFEPVRVLKGSFKSNVKSGIGRKSLVVIQFVISIVLIIGTLLAFDQLHYLRHADVGFNKQQVLVLPVSRTPIARQYDAFEGELLRSRLIKSVTTSDYIPGVDHNNHEFKPEGYPDTEWQFYPTIVVREDFLKLMEIPLVAGRDFSRKHATDAQSAILINEAMVKHQGWTNQSALGKKFHSHMGQEQVVGVFRNFATRSLHARRTPFVLNIKETPRTVYGFTNYVLIRFEAGHFQQMLAHVQAAWKLFAPDRPFEYSLLDQELDQLYVGENQLGTLVALLAGLVIFIATLGVFGLASFMAEKRTREIGIRKVLGASKSQLVRMVSGEFVYLILIANLIAWPLAWYLLDRWLSHFAYHTQINIWYFLFAGLLALSITYCITGIKALLAARANPAETLKYE